ncbi:MAG: hypothetical protein OXF79_22480 [Chloroflexi bacterium]|nr:hypothetical protein [Chloroflexota bacterium]
MGRDNNWQSDMVQSALRQADDAITQALRMGTPEDVLHEMIADRAIAISSPDDIVRLLDGIEPDPERIFDGDLPDGLTTIAQACREYHILNQTALRWVQRGDITSLGRKRVRGGATHVIRDRDFKHLANNLRPRGRPPK